MAWFISPGIARLIVNVPGRKQDIVFTRGGYRTADPVEIAVLRHDPRCVESFKKTKNKPAPTPIPPVSKLRPEEDSVSKPAPHILPEHGYPKPYAVDKVGNIIHDMDKAGTVCQLPDELMTAQFEDGSPWVFGQYQLYKRLSDAKRWNKKAVECPHCIDTRATA